MPIILGALVGMTLGLSRLGGSLLALPLLVCALGMPTRAAATTALAAVALSAAIGAGDGARARLLDIPTGLLLATAAAVTVTLGVLLADAVPAAAILTVHALLMLIVGILLWREAGGRPDRSRTVRAGLLLGPPSDCDEQPPGRLDARRALGLASAGLAMGLLAGFFGAGAGFIAVPALAAIGMGAGRAVATSLLAITIVAAVGTAGAFFGDREVPWFEAGLFVLGGVAGIGFALRLAGPLAGARLQRLVAAALVLAAAISGVGLWAGWWPAPPMAASEAASPVVPVPG